MDTELEQALIRALVRPAKRPRCLQFCGSSKRRGKLLDELRGPEIFEQERVTWVGAKGQKPSAYVDTLRAFGIKGPLYVVSSDEELDGKLVCVGDFARLAPNRGEDALGHCLQSGLGVYEHHHGETTYLIDTRRL